MLAVPETCARKTRERAAVSLGSVILAHRFSFGRPWVDSHEFGLLLLEVYDKTKSMKSRAGNNVMAARRNGSSSTPESKVGH